MSSTYLSKLETVSDAIAKYMADIGISVIFGVISIHNMPILDAIARQNKIRLTCGLFGYHHETFCQHLILQAIILVASEVLP